MPYPHLIRLRGPWQYSPLVCFGDGPLPPPGGVELPTDWGATLGECFRGRVRYERNFNSPTNLDPHERVWLVIDGADARADVSLNGDPLGAVEGYALSAEWDITEKLGPRNTLSIEVEQLDAASQGKPSSPEPPGHRQGSAPATGGQSKIQNPKSKISPPGHRQGSAPATDSAPATGAGPLRPGREHLPGGPIRQVRIEIRSAAFLDDFALWIAVGPKGPMLHCSGMVRGSAAGSQHSLVVGALQREILYENVTVGEQFAYTAEAGAMPVWAPGESCQLALAEIKLISGGEAVWQRQLETAAIAVESERQGLLTIGDRAITRPPFPVDFFSGDFQLQIQKLVNQLPAAERGVVLPQIWPEPLYTRLDRAGIAVWQAMPPEWAEHVCPRLAHHPSISAWCLPPEAPQRPAIPSVPCYGRPWVADG